MSDSTVAAPRRKTRRSARARRVVPLTILLCLSLFALFLIATQVVRAVLEVRNAQQIRNGAQGGIRPWMTIPYIARAYGVPEADLFGLLNLPATEQNRRAPLGALAKRNGRNLDSDLAAISGYLAERHATPRAPASAPPQQPSAPPGGRP